MKKPSTEDILLQIDCSCSSEMKEAVIVMEMNFPFLLSKEAIVYVALFSLIIDVIVSDIKGLLWKIDLNVISAGKLICFIPIVQGLFIG